MDRDCINYMVSRFSTLYQENIKEGINMINPKDLELLNSEEGRKQLDPEFVKEFSDGGKEEGEE